MNAFFSVFSDYRVLNMYAVNINREEGLGKYFSRNLHLYPKTLEGTS